MQYTERYIEFANNFSAREYADPAAYFAHRLHIIQSWCSRPERGECFLEIGCGDGYLAGLLVDRGYVVTACDKSPVMVDITAKRNQRHLEQGNLQVLELDVNSLPFPIEQRYDHVIAVMRSFFKYVEAPQATLREIFRVTRRRFVADFNPREINTRDVIHWVRSVGFKRVHVRAFLVPQKIILPSLVRQCLIACERIPPAYWLLTRRKFQLWVCGEK